MSLQEIGDAAGLSRGTPNYFFGSKQDLYVAVLERVFADPEEAAKHGRRGRRSGSDTEAGPANVRSRCGDCGRTSEPRRGGAALRGKVRQPDQRHPARGRARRRASPVDEFSIFHCGRARSQPLACRPARPQPARAALARSRLKHVGPGLRSAERTQSAAAGAQSPRVARARRFRRPRLASLRASADQREVDAARRKT